MRKTGSLKHIVILAAVTLLSIAPQIGFGQEDAELAGRIFLKFDIPQRKFYVNEQVPIALHLYSDWLDLESISVSGVSTGGLIVGDFKKGRTEIQESRGVRYAILTYNSFIMAPSSGNFELEPLSVSFYIAGVRRIEGAPKPEMLNDNEIFYDRILGSSERVFRRLKTAPVKIEIFPLPAEDVPAGFGGAIGSFELEASVSPLKVRAGEPVMLKAVLTGSGNFSAITSLGLENAEGFKVYDPKFIPGENKLMVEQVLRPLSSDIKDVPELKLSYFDPDKGGYVTVKKGPFPIKVEGILKDEGRPIQLPFSPKEALKTDKKLEIIDIKASFGNPVSMDGLYFWRGGSFRVMLAMPLIVLFAGILVKRRLYILETNIEYARQLRSSKIAGKELPRLEALARGGDKKAFYDHLFLFIRNYLGARFGIQPQSLTETSIGPILVERAVSPAVILKIKKVFSDCYLARFTSCVMNNNDISASLAAAREIVKL